MSDQEIEQRLQAASVAARDAAIVDAHRAGWSYRRIARVVGMSVAGVFKIVGRSKQ